MANAATRSPETTRAGLVTAYRKLIVRRTAIVAGLAALCVVALVLDMVTGSSGLGWTAVLQALFDPGLMAANDVFIVRELRLPHALMALLVGAALSLAGTEMQTLLDNPLSSPFTLGVSSAASFGAALAIVLGITLPGIGQDWMVSINAFVFAFGSLLLLQLLTRLRDAGTGTVILFGIALVFAFNALVTFIQSISSQTELQQLVFWTMGSLSRGTWPHVGILALILCLVVPFSLYAASSLTALRLGEDRARSLGVNVTRLRFASLLRVSLLAATSVAFVGIIGFVGLVGPHIARMLVGEDHRFLLPASVLSGAALMSLASALSKALVPGVVLPVGIVTSLVGVPLFLFLIFRRPGRV
ncbi:MAG TPA: iron ABC transporter permease [Oleiagrimonas sp.]|nr:iron ABC transporter permease [Oleiagrimonas sp.]